MESSKADGKSSVTQLISSDSTITQTLKRLFENRKSQILIAIIILLLASRLYLPYTGMRAPLPQGELVSGQAAQKGVSGLSEVLEYQNLLERQLSETLQSISGAGKVVVMLTLSSTSSVNIANNVQEVTRSSTENSSGGLTTKVTSEKTYSAQPVMLRVGSSVEEVIKLEERTPNINGVVVTATGATNPAVRAALSQAVQTILSLPAHRVNVFPGK
jgi:stage III sporulation protein AG